MIDVVEGIPQGKALDQWQSGPIEGFDTRIIGTNGYDEAEGAELFVVTAGIARKPGMWRDDLVKTNAGIVKFGGPRHCTRRAEGDHHRRLESARRDVLRCEEGERLSRASACSAWPACSTPRATACFSPRRSDVSVEDIQAMVLGGHGDTMVPLISYTRCRGIPVSQLIDQASSTPSSTARGTAAPKSSRLKTGSAYYAPSAAAVQMARRSRSTSNGSCRVRRGWTGEFGMTGMFLRRSVQARPQRSREHHRDHADRQERTDLRNSAEAVRETQAVVDAA